MNSEILTVHTCSGCSPELLDRYLKVISRRGAGEDAYRSELEDYQFELSVMAFRTKDKLRFTDRSVFNRAAFACLSGIGAVGSLMSAIWLGIAVSSPNQLDFLDLPLSAGDAGFWFAAMSCITVILVCLACLLMRSALTFRRTWSQEALNLLFMDCKIEQMIEKLEPPSEHPDGEAVAKRKESN